MRKRGWIAADDHGFTLIELLVVVSIVALLLAILLPALGRAREQARRAVCKSNLKQQVIACEMYKDEYNRYFPTSDDGYYAWGGIEGAENEVVKSRRLLNPYLSSKERIANQQGNSGPKVFFCPSDRGGRAAAWQVDRLPTMWDANGSSYHYTCSALDNDFGKGLWKKKDSQVRSPSKCLLVGDAVVITYFHGSQPFMSFYWHNQTVLGWANVAYVDCHVDYLQMTNSDPEHQEYTFQHGENWTVLYED